MIIFNATRFSQSHFFNSLNEENHGRNVQSNNYPISLTVDSSVFGFLRYIWFLLDNYLPDCCRRAQHKRTTKYLGNESPLHPAAEKKRNKMHLSLFWTGGPIKFRWPECCHIKAILETVISGFGSSISLLYGKTKIFQD